MEVKKLLVSFSGGETSAFMAQWLRKHKKLYEEIIFVFANTGQENEETLEFIDKCSKWFNFPVIWLEGVYHKQVGIGTTHKIVTFETACRDISLFESFISVYGIPNQAYPHCTRELKGQVIKSYARSIGWKHYHTAIGIRSDECDRISPNAKKMRLIYPLISYIPMTKPMINFWWSKQPFRLNLKGYQGNCMWCWKKSLPKLIKIAQESPEKFDGPVYLEKKYGNYFPAQRIEKLVPEGKQVPKNITFFRNNRSASEILEMAKTAKPIIKDDSENINIQLGIFDDPDNLDLVGGESCEVWSECNS